MAGFKLASGEAEIEKDPFMCNSRGWASVVLLCGEFSHGRKGKSTAGISLIQLVVSLFSGLKSSD
jgi:hypothetical protein